MIFLRQESLRDYLRYYPFTSFLLIANVAIFIILAFNGGSTDTQTLLRFGAVTNETPYRDELWRLVASIFLHNGFNHLLFNGFALLVFAPPLERHMGSSRYALVYLLSGILGNIISIAQYDHTGVPVVLVGASGALYGVYGAYLYIALLRRNVMDEGSRKMLLIMLAFGIIYSFAVPNIGWAAHLGGLIGGFFIYGLLVRLFKRRK